MNCLAQWKFFVFFCECLNARCGLTLINSQVLELLVFQVFGNDSQIWVRLCLNLSINHIWWGKYLALSRMSVHGYPDFFLCQPCNFFSNMYKYLYIFSLISLISLSFSNMSITPQEFCSGRQGCDWNEYCMGQERRVSVCVSLFVFFFFSHIGYLREHIIISSSSSLPLYCCLSLSLCRSLSQAGLLGGLEMARVRN